eukprot:PITA_05674
MWKILTDLYHNSNDQRKLALKDKLRKIKMEKGETIPKYLTKFTQCRDELGSVGITVGEEDMVSLSLLGLPKSSHSYQDSINAIKERKGKGKISRSKLDSYHGDKKTDMMKAKCFHCHKMGQFSTNYPLNKSKEKSSRGAAGEDLASQFELDFSLIACMVSSMMGSFWYLDSGASFQMIGDKELFSELEEKDLKMHIEMGDDGKYSVIGVGTITLQREHVGPLTLKNVMHVPRLMKNLISVAMLEDRGYDVIFSKGKAFLRHIAMGQRKDQTFTKFCEFKVLVEKGLGKKVKALQSDNGGEYVSNEFNNLCVAKGIKRELMTPHKPQQNGVLERKNRSIVGAARVMLHDQGLPLHLWDEACNTMIYV